jgi:hypothetical protein
MEGETRVLRICVDLNIWVANFLSRIRGGQRNSASNMIVRSVMLGRTSFWPLQLIVSPTMTNRLADVLVRRGVEMGDATAYADGILNFARRGPCLEQPLVVLGGGVEPTNESKTPSYNPYDPAILPKRMDDEDGRVLDTALAGRADLLATLNFDDFRSHHDEIIEDGFIHVRNTAHHKLLIMQGTRVAEWFRTGQFPGPKPEGKSNSL